MNKPTGNKLASYIRVSSDRQDTQRQVVSTEQWAGAQGLPLLFRFEDSEGRNPRDQAAKRPQFQALLAAIERREVDTVIVDSQDRFGTKNAHEFGKFVSFLQDNNCELWSTDRGLLSGDDDVTILTTTIGAMASRREQIDKAGRNLGGKINQAKQGIYQGGYPPFGFDVVCFAADGSEKWRVEYGAGHHRREKVYPDGTRERFDGKGNFPAKDPADVLKVRPTRNKQALEAARLVFEWFVTEDLSPRNIADRLAAQGCPPVAGVAWFGTKIRAQLQNPVYIGIPTYNKRAASRFREYLDGQQVDVKDKRQGRRRKPADYVQPPAAEFPPVVPVELWNKAQAKVKATSFKETGRKPRPARTAELAKLWLRPYLYCGKCGKPMRGNTAGPKGYQGRLTYNSYTCGSYGTYGKANPAGCLCHRVKADLLDSLVEKYIQEYQPHLLEMSDATDDPTRFDVAFNRLLTAVHQRNKLAQGMMVGEWNPLDLIGSYGAGYVQRMPDLDRQIAEKENTLDSMLEGFRGLSPAMRDRANRRMEAVQAELDALNSQRQDLRQPFAAVCAELRERVAALEVVNGPNDWKRAELLAGVVNRIVCYFDYKGNRSTLSAVEIYPSEGAPINLPSEAARGRD